MNTAQNNTYRAWLNDAHAMELALVTMLEKQAKETEDMPEMHAHIVKHLEETKGHAEKVEACIKRNYGDVSAAKDFMARMSATVNGFGMSMMEDAMVKNVHTSYAAEHFEIATYLTIASAAKELGDTETVAVCDDILEDEYRMAEWLKEQIPVVVRGHVKSLAD